MPAFDDLGLRPELLRVLTDEELERPTALQEAVIPALRRGGNLVARASTGAGKTLAYGLGVLDRLTPRAGEAGAEESTPLRMLVLVPTTGEAERVALQLFPLAQGTGLAVTIPGGTWGTPVNQAEILVSPVADVMDAVRGSALKLDDLEAVVIDGAAAIARLGDWERVDGLLDLVPRDAQRLVISAEFPDEVQDLIERRVKRALRYPSEAALPEERVTPVQGRIGYVVVPPSDKLEVLARQLSQPRDGATAPPVIFCRTDDRAAELAEQLSVRGFVVGTADDAESDVAVATADTTREEVLEEAEGELGQTISLDVPADARTLLARHGGDEDAVVLVEPRELPHIREIARQAGLSAVSVPLPIDRTAANQQLNAFREEVRRAAAQEDLSAQMLVLEPLFDELGASEVAAALAALLRRRLPAAPRQAEAPRQAAQARAAEPGPAPATWARLYVGIGSRDDIRPGDLVGTLAGEANIPGSKIGKIDIRDSFSIVEVQADVADRVIQAVNGTTIKGRSARVDYDRGGDRARRQPGGRPGGDRPPARRLTRRPPRE